MTLKIVKVVYLMLAKEPEQNTNCGLTAILFFDASDELDKQCSITRFDGFSYLVRRPKLICRENRSL